LGSKPPANEVVVKFLDDQIEQRIARSQPQRPQSLC